MTFVAKWIRTCVQYESVYSTEDDAIVEVDQLTAADQLNGNELMRAPAIEGVRGWTHQG